MRNIAEIDMSIDALRPQLKTDRAATMLLIDILLDERLEVMNYVAENSATKG